MGPVGQRAAAAAAAGPAQLQVERVVGLSPPTCAAVAYCPTQPHLACFPAGPFAVVLDTQSQQQRHLLRSPAGGKPLTCVAWSACGDHVAGGEAAGGAGSQQASVLVWALGSGACVHELKAHKQGVGSLRFAPDGKLLASAGAPPDGQLCLWDWRAGCLLWRQSVGAALCSAAFTEDGSHLLAVGHALFKSWSISSGVQQQQQPGRAPGAKHAASAGGGGGGGGSSVCLTSRPVALRELGSSGFVDVCVAPCAAGQPPGSNGVYALAGDTGLLVLMRSMGRNIDKSVDLQVSAAFGLAACPSLVAAACAAGVVRLLAAKTLALRATLPGLAGRDEEPAPAPGGGGGTGSRGGAGLPDARGCSFSPIAAEQQLLVAYSDQSLVVWDTRDLTKVTRVLRLSAHGGGVRDVCTLPAPAPAGDRAPQGAWCASCSADGTVRLWDLSADAPGHGRVVTAAGVQVRCVRVSPDRRHLAAGDSAGSLRVFDCAELRPLLALEAHDGEVSCLEYSPLGAGGRQGGCLAASGGRDGLVRVFDAAAGYAPRQTLREHAGAVTGVAWTRGGAGLVSCGADRRVVFRLLGAGPNGAVVSVRTEDSVPGGLQCLAANPRDGCVYTAGQDGLLRAWDAGSGELRRTMVPEAGAGEPVQVATDPGGAVLVCCHADGCVRLCDPASGRLLWRGRGHAGAVAAAAITPDLTRLVSVGGDGCMVVWRLPEDATASMRTAAAAAAAAERAAADAAAPQGLADQQRRAATGSPPAAPCTADGRASPAAEGAATPRTGGTEAAAGARDSSDSGLGSTLARVRQGKPLVPSEKLPKWARSPTSSPSRSSPTRAAARQPLFSRWLNGTQRAKSKWLAGKEAGGARLPAGEPTPEQALAEGDVRRVSLDVGSASALGAGTAGDRGPPKEPWSVWPQDDSAGAEQQEWGSGGPLARASHCSQQVPSTAGAAASLDTSGGQTSAAGTGALSADVARDLFKAHFRSLSSSGGGSSSSSSAAGAGWRQHRDSLPGRLKTGRASSSGVPARAHGTDSGSAAAGLGPQATPPAAPAQAMEQAAAAEPRAQPPVLEVDSPPVASGERRPGSGPLSGQPSPKRRWRNGEMHADLQDMRQRLDSLQALYHEQVMQRQAASPRQRRSGCGSSDDAPGQPPDEVAEPQAPARDPPAVPAAGAAGDAAPASAPAATPVTSSAGSTGVGASRKQQRPAGNRGGSSSTAASRQCAQSKSAGGGGRQQGASKSPAPGAPTVPGAKSTPARPTPGLLLPRRQGPCAAGAAATPAAEGEKASGRSHSPGLARSCELLAQLLSNSPGHSPSPRREAAAGSTEVREGGSSPAAPQGRGSARASPCRPQGDGALSVSIGTSIAAAVAAGGGGDPAAAPVARPMWCRLSLPHQIEAGSAANKADVQQAAVAPEPGSVSAGQQQQQQQQPGSDIASGGGGDAAAAGAAGAGPGGAHPDGAMVTPNGQHTLWPGWGPQPNAWEGLTPSPVAAGVPQFSSIWAAVSSDEPMGSPRAAAAASSSSGSGGSAGPSAGLPTGPRTSGAGHAPPGTQVRWLHHNAVYDATPAHSTPGSACTSSMGLAAQPLVSLSEYAADLAESISLDAVGRGQQPEGSEPEPSPPVSVPGLQPTSSEAVHSQLAPAQPEQPPQQQQQQLPGSSGSVGGGRRHFVSDGRSSSGPAASLAVESDPTSPASSSTTSRAPDADGGGRLSSGRKACKGKGPTRRERAAAKAASKAAAKALQGCAPSDRSGSPGSTMLSLLQRIKRTMPGIKRSSCGGSRDSSLAASRAPSASSAREHQALLPGPRGGASPMLARAARASGASVAAEARTAGGAGSACVSPDSVRLDIPAAGPAAAGPPAAAGATEAPPGAGCWAVTGAWPRRGSSPRSGADGSVVVAAAAACAEAQSAAKRRTAKQLAASVASFKRSAAEMQQLWLQLQTLQLDADEASELTQLLVQAQAPPLQQQQQPSPAAALVSRSPPWTPPSAAFGCVPSPSPPSKQESEEAEPTLLVRRRLQDELLRTVWDLHSTVTGAPPGCSSDSLPPCTPPFAAGGQPGALHSGHPYPFASPAASAPGSGGAAPRFPVAAPRGVGGLPPEGAGGEWPSPAASPGWSTGLAEGVPKARPGPPMDQLEGFTSKICEQFASILVDKLDGRHAQGAGGGGGGGGGGSPGVAGTQRQSAPHDHRGGGW